MRGVTAAATAVLVALVLLPSAAGAGTAPSREELLRKSPKELKALLRSKGASCKKCTEKEDIVDRVIETWDWVLNEAVSPDGKVRMTKDMFVHNLQQSYKRHMEEQKQAQGRKQNEDGHQLASDDDEEGDSPPEEGDVPVVDAERVWADFSEKLRQGKIRMDENGNLQYDVAESVDARPWWERNWTHVLMVVNIVMLLCLQLGRRAGRQHKQQAVAAPAAAPATKAKGTKDKHS